MKINSFLKKVLFALSVVFLTSCGIGKVNVHGTFVESHEVRKIKINDTQESELIEILGPPGTKIKRGNITYYYYIYKITTSGESMTSRVLKQNIYEFAVRNGLVIKYKRYTTKDKRNITFYQNNTEKLNPKNLINNLRIIPKF